MRPSIEPQAGAARLEPQHALHSRWCVSYTPQIVVVFSILLSDAQPVAVFGSALHTTARYHDCTVARSIRRRSLRLADGRLNEVTNAVREDGNGVCGGGCSL